MAQQGFEPAASLDLPHSTQGTGGGRGHALVEVIEEVDQKRDQLRQWTGAATRISPDARLGVSQQPAQSTRR